MNKKAIYKITGGILFPAFNLFLVFLKAKRLLTILHYPVIIFTEFIFGKSDLAFIFGIMLAIAYDIIIGMFIGYIIYKIKRK